MRMPSENEYEQHTSCQMHTNDLIVQVRVTNERTPMFYVETFCACFLFGEIYRYPQIRSHMIRIL